MITTGIRNRLYYTLRPWIPRRAQVWLRSQWARRKHAASAEVWPILKHAGDLPPDWPGWPEGRRFAIALAHDVETAIGHSRVGQLMRLEQALGFRSSFNFVPERYQVSPEVRQVLTDHGFEVGVHGLVHDGKLFESYITFAQRAKRINRYLRDWHAAGFVSPSSHHHLEWMHDLEIEYDSSTFDTDPFEPQPDGVDTIFPIWVAHPSNGGGYVELPYTLPQDYTLFILLRESGNEIWKRKLRWIADHGGMVFLIAHPDYMHFGGGRASYQEYPVDLYLDFLKHVQTEYADQYWHALPREVAAFYRMHTEQLQCRPEPPHVEAQAPVTAQLGSTR